MSDNVPTSESLALARRLAAVLAKKEQGGSLDQEDENVLLATALRYLEEHGHEIALELLPELPEGHRKALAEARARALTCAVEILKQSEPTKRSGHTR